MSDQDQNVRPKCPTKTKISDQIVGLRECWLSNLSDICRTFWEECVGPESLIVDTLGVYCTKKTMTYDCVTILFNLYNNNINNVQAMWIPQQLHNNLGMIDFQEKVEFKYFDIFL
jgi:hypothetical protein